MGTPSELDLLTQRMSGNTAPGAVAASAPADGPKAFWVVKNGATVAATPAQLAELVQQGYDDPVADQATGVWKKAADFGFVRAVVAPTPPPAPTAAAPLPPTPPPAPVAPQAPTAPAANQPPSLAAAAVHAVAPATGGTLLHTAGDRELPMLVRDEAGASAVLALLQTPDVAVFDIVDATESSGMSYALPFVTADEKGWQTPKHVKEMKGEVEENLPAGDRPWVGIYIASRLGAIGWAGGGTAGQKGTPPLYRFVVPSPRVNPTSHQLLQDMMKIASRIQFTKNDDRVKFDKLGRLNPFINTLVWRPGIGFCLLVGNGFSAVQITNPEARKWDEKCVFKPVRFALEVQETVNKKVLAANPEAKNAKWTNVGIKGEIDADARSSAMLQEFMLAMQRDKIGMVNVVQAFLEGRDFEGLSLAEITALLPKYADLIVENKEERA